MSATRFQKFAAFRESIVPLLYQPSLSDSHKVYFTYSGLGGIG